MVDLALRIIEQKSGHFDPKELAVERYEEALRRLVEQKVKGETPVLPKSTEPTKVINLMDALRRSLAAESGKTRTPVPADGRRGTAARPDTKRRRAS
jgi:DNA end-binding protein Ku